MATLGEFTTALELRQRAATIVEDAFGESLILAGYLNDVAVSYVLQGEYSNARSLYERALAIHERNQGPLDGAATFTYNLADVARRLGDYSSAAKYELRAISLWKQAFGDQHPFVATGLFALGDVRMAQGRSSEAARLYQRALTLRERAFGATHVEVARTLADLAGADLQAGRLASADALSARAIRIWESADTAISTDFAHALSVKGDVRAAAGDYRAARGLYERSLDLLTGVLGPDHRSVAEARLKVGQAFAALHDTAAAFHQAIEAERIGRDHLRLSVRYLPEREALTYAAARPKGLDLALSMLVERDHPAGAAESAMDSVVKARGVVFDEMAARHRTVLSQADRGLEPLWQELSDARQQVANLAVRGSVDRPDQYRQLMEQAIAHRDRAERELAAKSATFRAEIDRGNVGLADVRAALPAGSALIAYVRYDRTTTAPADRLRTVPSYLAFVLRAGDTQPIVRALGSAERIEAAIDLWRRRLAAGALESQNAAIEGEYRAAGAILRRLVWDPVSANLGGVERALIVPDGALNLLDFGALPTSSSKYLAESATAIHYLSAERDLLSPAGAGNAAGGLLAMGGPAFDDLPVPARAKASTLREAPLGCDSLQSVRFQPLPGTRREVADIARVWDEGSATDAGVEVLTGAAATEAAFKQHAPGHRVLHVATHGFFLDGSCRPAAPAAGRRAVGGLIAAKAPPADRHRERNPLLLSGIALAGANHRSGARPADDDGILTAEEVAGLNLDGVEWAVLSACDTGLGEIKAGEGVFGLRRAFQIAGVRTVIMSLWSVGDEASRRWMLRLYEGRLLRHLSTSEAVRDANLSVLRERRSKGLSTHPFYWAGFVAAGDWR